jgi:hypothetical protein
MPDWLVDVHRPPVRLHPGPGPPVGDGTVGEDDFFTTRLRCCLWCGKREVTLAQMLVYVGGRAVAATQCRRCRDTDPTMTALQAMLVQRYGDQGKEES